ncbi:MAG: NUDIX domain-containing protein [Acidimicrobiales bacterium]
MKSRTLTSAGGVIVDPQGRVVLTARRSFHGELQWGLPKGLVEPGEELAAAAVREAREETGLEVRVLGPLRVIDYWFVEPGRAEAPPGRVHKFVHLFLLEAVGGDPALHDSETEEVVFLEPEQALRRASFESEREVIRAAAEAAGKSPR